MAEAGGQEFVEVLGRIPVFGNLTMEECRKLMGICKKASFFTGKTIYTAGAPGNQMLILLKGTVSIHMSDGTEIAKVEPPDTVGEMEIVGALPRAARAVADTAVSGLTVDRPELEKLIHGEPELGIKILKNLVDSLARKLDATNQQLQRIGKAAGSNA